MNKTNTKERASCRHLTYKHSAYYGCTLGEVCLIACIYMMLDLLVSCVMAVFFGFFFLFLLGGFILSLIMIRLTAKVIGHYKEAKQHGFLLLRFRQFLNYYLGISVPYTKRIGIWGTRRSLWR